MLALACDYRIMHGGHGEEHLPTIGFNETQLGMYVLILLLVVLHIVVIQ